MARGRRDAEGEALHQAALYEQTPALQGRMDSARGIGSEGGQDCQDPPHGARRNLCRLAYRGAAATTLVKKKGMP